LVSVDPKVTAVDPSFSPDGKSLAWAQWREESNVPPRVYVGRSNGSGGRPVATGFDPEFSPDGRSLVFVRQGRCRGGGGLRTMIVAFSLDSGQQQLLKSTCGVEREISDPVYSPDGGWIAYTASQGERAEVAFVPVPGVFSLTTSLAPLGMAPSIALAPSWQPIPD
jgi:Tol biopolymer transport system component